jgi:hypothetical protein
MLLRNVSIPGRFRAVLLAKVAHTDARISWLNSDGPARTRPGPSGNSHEIEVSHEYKHRGRDSSGASDLQFWARHSIAAEAVAKAPHRMHPT